jgi:hypothetical protein
MDAECKGIVAWDVGVYHCVAGACARMELVSQCTLQPLLLVVSLHKTGKCFVENNTQKQNQEHGCNAQIL